MKNDSFLIISTKGGEKIAKKIININRTNHTVLKIILTAASAIIFYEHLRINELNDKIDYLNRKLEGTEPKGE